MKFISLLLIFLLSACVEIEPESENLGGDIPTHEGDQNSSGENTAEGDGLVEGTPTDEDDVGNETANNASDPIDSSEDEVADNNDASDAAAGNNDGNESSSDEATDNTGDVADNNENQDAIFSPITLSWHAPTRDELDNLIDVSDIDTYMVHWGTDENDLSGTIRLEGDQSSYVFSPEQSGYYYFSITVTTIYGDESLLSSVVQTFVE